MSASSQFYRPAVLVITGVAAACGIYVLYTTYNDRPAKSGGSLRRSNAVHRTPGNERPRVTVEYARPSGEATLGWVTVRRGTQSHAFDLVFDANPSVSAVRNYLGPIDDSDLQSDLNVAIVGSILQACLLASTDFERARLDHLRPGLEMVSEVLSDRDILNIHRRAIPILREALPTIREQDILSSVEKFLHSEMFNSSEAEDTEPNLTIANTDDIINGPDSEPSQGLKGLLYHIAENDAKRKAYEHRGIHCEECGEHPIRGVRWHCLNCPNFDLCSTCETSSEHQPTHVFVKIKIPIPVLSQPTKELPPWYPGDGRLRPNLLGQSMRKQLQEEYDFEPAQIDALYDQFSALAKETPSSDVSHGSFGIDRAAFDMALTNERWRSRFRPNVIFDRMFAFYDKDSDGKIGFSDFVSGMAYLCSAKRYNPLHRAVQGYDLNGDGYVDRSDIIRLLRAKYEIQRLITADMIDALEDERNHEVVDSLRSSQPISAIFTEGDIPASQSRPIVGKTMDQYGDMQPEPRQKTILDEGERLEARRGRRQSTEHSFGGVQGDAAQNESNRGLHTYGEPGRLCSLDGSGMQPARRFTKEADQSFSEDALWSVVEEGLNEQLNLLFGGREEADNAAIGYGITEGEEARSDSLGWSASDESGLYVVAGSATVHASGFSERERAPPNPQPPSHQTASPDEIAYDPTMPQHRPNAIASADTCNDGQDSNRAVTSKAGSEASAEGTTNKPPSKVDLGILVRNEERDREVKARGGPGRLTYDEIEQAVENHPQLRGLIISWLEWASF